MAFSHWGVLTSSRQAQLRGPFSAASHTEVIQLRVCSQSSVNTCLTPTLNRALRRTGPMHYSCAGTATAYKCNKCLTVEEHKDKVSVVDWCKRPGVVGAAWPSLLEEAGKAASKRQWTLCPGMKVRAGGWGESQKVIRGQQGSRHVDVCSQMGRRDR